MANTSEKYYRKEYNWNTYINDKAIIEFERNNCLISSKIGMDGYYLLSFFVDLYINPKKAKNIKTEYINEVKYIYVSSSFILNNLLLLKVSKSTLIRNINKLERYGYIQRVILYNVRRYVKINQELLQYYKLKNKDMFQPKHLKELAKEIGDYFGRTTEHQLISVYKFLSNLEDIDYFKAKFHDYREYKEYSNEIRPRFENYCKTWDNENWIVLLQRQEHIELKNKYKNLR